MVRAGRSPFAPGTTYWLPERLPLFAAWYETKLTAIESARQAAQAWLKAAEAAVRAYQVKEANPGWHRPSPGTEAGITLTVEQTLLLDGGSSELGSPGSEEQLLAITAADIRTRQEQSKAAGEETSALKAWTVYEVAQFHARFGRALEEEG